MLVWTYILQNIQPQSIFCSFQLDLYVMQASHNMVDISTVTNTNVYNRLWVRLWAEEMENVWGAGEQYSYLNLRGRHYPVWTSEQGEHPHIRKYSQFRMESLSLTLQERFTIVVMTVSAPRHAIPC